MPGGVSGKEGEEALGHLVSAEQRFPEGRKVKGPGLMRQHLNWLLFGPGFSGGL